MLNADAIVCCFGDAAPTIDYFFIRPTADSKYFAGTVMSGKELSDWKQKVAVLGEDDGSGLRADTEIMWAAPKHIDAEYRTWVIDGKIVTATRYPKSGPADTAALSFARRMVEIYAPLRAFVLDVCLSDDVWKIVEINTINAAGFYAADLDALVGAIQAMPFNAHGL